jgi:hypothetical protein
MSGNREMSLRPTQNTRTIGVLEDFPLLDMPSFILFAPLPIQRALQLVYISKRKAEAEGGRREIPALAF